MKNQVLVGYLKKNKYGSSRVRVQVKLCQKTLASVAKWSIDTKVWNMCLWQRKIFRGHRTLQHFYHVSSFKSTNIVFETGKYHSWPNTLPFRVGYWGANTLLPAQSQVLVPALLSTTLCRKWRWLIMNTTNSPQFRVWALRQCVTKRQEQQNHT